jgi:hypothetical protein
MIVAIQKQTTFDRLIPMMKSKTKTHIRKIMRLVPILLAVGFVRPSVSAVDQPANFRCPEDLPNQAAREAATEDFVHWFAERHGGVTSIRAVTDARMKLLQANHCTKTLAYIDATEKTDQVASRYACVDQHKKRYFSVKPGDMCKALPLERDWQNFTITPDVVVDILPSKMVVDQDGAKKLCFVPVRW